MGAGQKIMILLNIFIENIFYIWYTHLMISRKYLSDYRLEEQFDNKGRVKTRTVYIGPDYMLAPPVTAAKRKAILFASALAALAFTLALVPVTQAARVIYVIVPFALAGLPICQMLKAALSLYRAGKAEKGASEKQDGGGMSGDEQTRLRGSALTRKEAEKIANSLPLTSIITAILCAGSLLAIIVSAALTWEKYSANDALFAASALIITICSAAVFIGTKNIKAVAMN